MQLNELGLNRQLYKQAQSIETQDSSYESANNSSGTGASVASGSAAFDVNTGSVPINTTQLNGNIPSTLLDISDLGWTQNCVFSVTSATKVSWGSGTFTSAKGLSYSILAGDTGTMAAKTYVYLDINVSLTNYQITTSPTDCIGVGKVLIAVCQNGASSATYVPVEATQIVGDNILANTINANKIVSGSITTTQLNATAIDGMTITGALIRTSSGAQRIEMKNDNTIIFYDGGIPRTYVSNGIISFNRPDGTGAGSIASWGSNQIGINVGAENFFFDTGAAWTDSTSDLGRTSSRWNKAYFAGVIDTYGNLEVDGTGNIGGNTIIGGNLRVYGSFIPQDGVSGVAVDTSGQVLIFTNGLLTDII